MSQTAIDAEVIPQTQAVAIREQPGAVSTGLFGDAKPVQIIERATDIATALKAVISKQGLISKISGREYPKCEAWTLLGTMLGVFPVLCWTKQVEGGWEARVEARTKDGAIVGAAEAQCLKSEKNWSNRDDFALRSMAQTRATAKCLRMPLGFVMTLAGYEATPAEEMIADHAHQNAPGRAASPPPSQRPTQAANAPATPRAVTPAPSNAPLATAETRKRVIAGLQAGEGQPNRALVKEYFVKCAQLLDTENVEDLPLRFVPTTKRQMDAMAKCVSDFEAGAPAARAFAPNEEAAPAKTKAAPAAKPIEVPRDPPGPPAADPNAEWFMGVIVPVPRKGMKRDEYLKSPDTIGSLYEARHGQNADSQELRQRLWGFVTHYEPKGWTKKDGTQMPASESDKKFREALDAFKEFFDKEHPGERL